MSKVCFSICFTITEKISRPFTKFESKDFSGGHVRSNVWELLNPSSSICASSDSLKTNPPEIHHESSLIVCGLLTDSVKVHKAHGYGFFQDDPKMSIDFE